MTVEERLKMIVGDMVFQLAVAASKAEEQAARIAELEAAAKKPTEERE